MDQRVLKLRMKLDGDAYIQDIKALVTAGFDRPQRIREASDEELLAVSGIGPAKLAALRAAFPPQQ